MNYYLTTGIIMISINETEQAQLKLLMDEKFGNNNLLSVHHIQTRYANKDVANNGAQWLPIIEYVYIYAKDSSNFKPNLPVEDYNLEPYHFTIEELSAGKKINVHGKEVEIFKKGQYKITKHTDNDVSYLKEIWGSGSLLKQKNTAAWYYNEYLLDRLPVDGVDTLYKIYNMGEDGLGYRYVKGPKNEGNTRSKVYQGVPLDKRLGIENGTGANKFKPIINFYDYSPDFGNIVNEGGVAFNNGKKPIKMIKELINYHKGKDITVLDFFAGSGSTAQAVLDLNNEDGGTRKFILCTNNENNICEDVTYKRLKNVITGYGSFKALNANLKYFKTNYIPRLNTDDENIQENLLKDIGTLIQLQNGTSLENKKIQIVLSEDEIDNFSENTEDVKKCEKLYVSSDVLLTSKQVKIFKDNNIKTYVIPECYFGKEIKEV